MKTYERPLSITSQVPFCSVPLRLDTYTHCQFGCAYCFAKARGGNLEHKGVSAAKPDTLRARLTHAAASAPPRSALDEMLAHRVPIQFGGMSDPFGKLEVVNRTSLRLMDILNAFDYPTLISTKSTLIDHDDYVARLRNGNYFVRISLTGAPPHIADGLETGVEPISRRLQTIETLSRQGVVVAARLQPIIPGCEDHIFRLLESIASAGARQISAEYLKWPIEADSQQSKLLEHILQFDKSEYNKLGSMRVGRECVLPATYKYAFLSRMKAYAEKLGLLFGYADNEFLHLNEFESCCNGADRFLRDAKIFKCNILTAIRNQKDGFIYFDEIKKHWRPKNNLSSILNTNSRIMKVRKDQEEWIEILRRKWNSSAWRGGPMSFYGVRKANFLDADGNSVYLSEPSI